MAGERIVWLTMSELLLRVSWVLDRLRERRSWQTTATSSQRSRCASGREGARVCVCVDMCGVCVCVCVWCVCGVCVPLVTTKEVTVVWGALAVV